VADLDESTGAIQIFGVRRVVAEVTDPLKEISLEDARRTHPEAELDTEIRFPNRPKRWDASRPRRPSR